MAGEIFGALHRAMANLPALKKTRTNPDTRSKYIPLDDILATVKPVLSAEGLFVVQSARIADNNVIVDTHIYHVNGERLSSEAAVPLIGRMKAGGGRWEPDPQAGGSAISYARRYGLAAALGLVADTDDDGRAARPSEGQARPTAKASSAPAPSGPRPRARAQAALDGIVYEEGSRIMPKGPYTGKSFTVIPKRELERVKDALIKGGAPANVAMLLRDIKQTLAARALQEEPEPADEAHDQG